MTFVISNRGKQKFAENGYVYVMNKKSADGDRIFWNCEQLKSDGCKARVHTKTGDPTVIKRINEHNHSGSGARVEIINAKTEVKERARTTQESTSAIVTHATAGLSIAAKGEIAKLSSLKKISQRQRQLVGLAPPAPSALRDLVIPQNFREYEVQNGHTEAFLLYDSGPANDRILIFGRESGMEILRHSNRWYADGTFKTAPTLFYQIYVILAESLGAVHPVLYCCLASKDRRTYERLFEAVKNLCNRPHEPQSISVDFEIAAFQAWEVTYPNTQLYGCLFHLHKNMKKKVAEEGLLHRFNSDGDFALNARMIVSLVFVPPQDLDEAVDELSDELPLDLQPVLSWFEDNYMGRVNRRGQGRRPPLFPIVLWNMYERVLNHEARTNNSAEAANRRIGSELQMDHPVIWKFIDALKKIQKERDLIHEQLIAGHQPPRKRRKYRQADQRIETIVLDYANRSKIDYLRGLAHNFEMNS